MQNGIQPRHVTAQTPNAHPLNGKKNDSNQLLAFTQRGKRFLSSRPDSLCISARHIFRLADRSLLAYGTLDRDGRVAEGGPVIYVLLALRLERLGVLHRGHGSDVGLVC